VLLRLVLAVLFLSQVVPALLTPLARSRLLLAPVPPTAVVLVLVRVLRAPLVAPSRFVRALA